MYNKELYLFRKDGTSVKALIRSYRREDFKELINIQAESFPPPFPSELWWNEEQLTNHITLFPQGALCVEIAGELAGSMTGLVVNFDPQDPDHSWDEITDSGYIRNHNPQGNTLYVVDLCVRPKYRGLGLGKWLMQSMYEVVVYKNLKRLLGGGRMPGYHKEAQQITAEQYLEKVVAGQLVDPVVTPLLHYGRTPVRVVANYLEDEESLNYGALMEWKNPFI